YSAKKTAKAYFDALRQPHVGFGERRHVSLRDGRDSREVEAVQALVERQTAVSAVASEAARLPFTHLPLEQRPKEALGWPSLAVSLLGQIRPQSAHRGQP